MADHSGVPLFVPVSAEKGFLEKYATRRLNREARRPETINHTPNATLWWKQTSQSSAKANPDAPRSGLFSRFALWLLFFATASLALLRGYHHLANAKAIPAIPFLTSSHARVEELLLSYSGVWDRLMWLHHLGLSGHPVIKSVRIEILFFSQFFFLLAFLAVRALITRGSTAKDIAASKDASKVDLSTNYPMPDGAKLLSGVQSLLDGYKVPSSPTQLFFTLYSHCNALFLKKSESSAPVSPLQAIQLLALTTALADYYVHDLPTAYRMLKKQFEILKTRAKKAKEVKVPAESDDAAAGTREDDEDAELFVPKSHAENLLYIVRKIGERLEFYEGAGLPERFTEYPTSLGAYVAHFHRSLFALMPTEFQKNFDAILADYLAHIFSPEAEISREIVLLLVRKPRLVEANATQLDDHYRLRPAHTATLKRFDAELREKSQCLFAAKSRLWSGLDVSDDFWTKPGAIEEYARLTLPLLTRFIVIARYEHLDGFIWAIPNRAIDGDLSKGTWGESPQHVGTAMWRLLHELARLDPSGDNCLEDENEVSARSWQYRHTSQRCFMTSFAPCYPDEYVWILLQPEYSFSYHNIDNTVTGADTGARKKVHKSFVQAGRPYREPKAPTPNAGMYVRPMDEMDGEMVVWWKRPTQDEDARHE